MRYLKVALNPSFDTFRNDNAGIKLFMRQFYPHLRVGLNRRSRAEVPQPSSGFVRGFGIIPFFLMTKSGSQPPNARYNDISFQR